jgi:hypothetical protein
LLVGRKNLEGGEIEGNKIEDNEEDVKTVDCEKFSFNYVGRCVVSLYSANLIIDRAAIEIASTY